MKTEHFDPSELSDEELEVWEFAEQGRVSDVLEAIDRELNRIGHELVVGDADYDNNTWFRVEPKQDLNNQHERDER